MTRKSIFLTTCSILTLLLPASSADAASDPPDLSGVWELNEDRSEDPREKMADQMRSQGGGSGGGGTRSGKGGGGGGRGGGGRGGGRGGEDDGQAARDRMLSMQAGVKTLTIAHHDPEISIHYANDQQRSLFTDGRDLQYEIGSGFYDEKAKWKGGDRLVVHGMSSQGGEMKQVFELSKSGTNLFVTTEVAHDGDLPKMEFLRVYDRVEDEASDG